MSKLPETINVDQGFAFYLAPTGAAGSEALVYLPAYNDALRNRYEKKGFRLLSQCVGDFSDAESPLRIEPPSDDALREAIETMKARIPEEDAKLKERAAEAERMVKDQLVEASERRLWSDRLRQLKLLRQNITNGVPSFAELKRMCYRVHRHMLALRVPPNVRRAVSQMAEERYWADQTAELTEEVAREEREPAAAATE